MRATLKMIVKASVAGATSHTPVMPNNFGNVKMQINNTTNPLDNEIIADSFAFPIEVKQKELMVLIPENRKDRIKIGHQEKYLQTTQIGTFIRY